MDNINYFCDYIYKQKKRDYRLDSSRVFQWLRNFTLPGAICAGEAMMDVTFPLL